jgi:predicted transcriptional regulator
MMGRPDLFVIGRLLEAMTTSATPIRRTPLQQRAGVNYTVFQRYLDFLLRQGLVVATPGSEELLQLTPKGVEAYRFLSEGFARIFGPPNGGPSPPATPSRGTPSKGPGPP